jgi:hypothetical protein
MTLVNCTAELVNQLGVARQIKFAEKRISAERKSSTRPSDREFFSSLFSVSKTQLVGFRKEKRQHIQNEQRAERSTGLLVPCATSRAANLMIFCCKFPATIRNLFYRSDMLSV